MVNRINELKKLNPQQTCVIYANKICLRAADGSKPTPISDPLNIIPQNNTNFNAEAMSIDNQRMRLPQLLNVEKFVTSFYLLNAYINRHFSQSFD